MAFRRKTMAAMLAASLAAAGMFAMPRAAYAVPTQEDLQAAQARIDELGADLISFREDLENAEAALVRTDNEIGKTEEKIDQTQIELAAARVTLARRMRSGYKTGGVNFLDVLFNSTSLEDFANRIYYMDKVNEQDANTIDRIGELEAQLEDQKAHLEEQKVAQEQNLAEVEQKVGEYESLVAEAQEYYNQLDAEIQAELARQAEEEARRAAEAEAAAQAAAQQSAAAAVIEVAGGGTSDSGSESSSSSDTTSDPGVQNTEGSTDPGDSEIVEDPTSGSDQPFPGQGVASAYSCLGWPYVWGGYNLSTGGFDCSGLVSYCYGTGTWRAGAEPLGLAIINAGLWKDSLDQLVPGDLVFTRSNFDHIAIYIGGGMMIHAPYPGAVVCVAPVYAFYGGGPFVYPY